MAFQAVELHRDGLLEVLEVGSQSTIQGGWGAGRGGVKGKVQGGGDDEHGDDEHGVVPQRSSRAVRAVHETGKLTSRDP